MLPGRWVRKPSLCEACNHSQKPACRHHRNILSPSGLRGPAASAAPGNLLEMKFLGSTQDLLNQNLEESLRDGVITSLSGDSDPQSSSRTPAILENALLIIFFYSKETKQRPREAESLAPNQTAQWCQARAKNPGLLHPEGISPLTTQPKQWPPNRRSVQ